ncbi:MAG: acyltransferase family protein [Oscillospiraceae bacterium]|nr:acyltransferase family protein [Oscillospiraceae bacterium]
MENQTIAAAAAPAGTAPGKPRYVGIDLVKILACMLVVCVHFFLYSGFYNQPITKDFGQAPIFMRWTAYCCVPLFMITTGYLMKNKTLSKKYYLGIIRVLVIYLICSVICYAYDHHHYPQKYDTPYGGYSAWMFIRGLFMFSDAQYAWYVEYYFCIFLIIPFLNLAFNGLKSQKHRQIMVITAIMITILSQSLYIGFDYEHSTQMKLFPGYFTRCYPIAYYLIGAYIREYPPKRTLINKLYFLGMFLLSLAWVSTTTYQQSMLNEENNFIMISRHYNDYGSWPVALCSIMLFLLLFDIQSKNKVLIQILKFISESTFACYLVSYVFDTHFYQPDSAFGKSYHTPPERWAHCYEVLPKIFFSAMGLALVIQAVYNAGDWFVRKVLIPTARYADYDEVVAGKPYAAPADNTPESPKNQIAGSQKLKAELDKLKVLQMEGALTQEEYEQIKKEMIEKAARSDS